MQSFAPCSQGPTRTQPASLIRSKPTLRYTCSADETHDAAKPTLYDKSKTPSGFLSRRNVLGGIALTAALERTGSANAGYNPDLLQPCSSLDQCRKTLRGIEKNLEADPEDVDSEGLKYFFETEVERLEKNKAFVDSTNKAVKSGENKFIQRVVIAVESSKFDDTVDFWTKGLGMKINRKSTDDASGMRTVFVTYGAETLLEDAGGNFAIQLVESTSTSQPAWLVSGPQLKHIQVTIGNVRLGNIVDSGAEVLYSYGYLELLAPDGTRVNSRVGIRRDPIELLCYEVEDIDASVRYYEQVLGMKVLETTPPFECSQVKEGILGAFGFARNKCVPPPYSTFSPRNVPGSVLLSYGDKKETVGILLSPKGPIYNPSEYTPKAASEAMLVPAVPGTRYQNLAILTKDGAELGQKAEVDGAKVELVGKVPGIGVRGAVVRDANGFAISLLDYDDFEKSL